MNKKIEEHNEDQSVLSEVESRMIDQEALIEEKISELARQIHLEKFSEEYDFMYDSNADLNDRNNGINPMSKEYIEKIRMKRAALGVSQLSDCGMPVSDDTHDLCRQEAKKQIYSDLNLNTSGED